MDLPCRGSLVAMVIAAVYVYCTENGRKNQQSLLSETGHSDLVAQEKRTKTTSIFPMRKGLECVVPWVS